MSQVTLRHVQESSNSIRKDVRPLKAGYKVKVHQKILESTKDGMKERIQIYEGLVIAVSSGGGVDKTFTVRKISEGVGVEKIFPIHSKSIAKVEVISNSKVRRSKLYFMRDRQGKSARLKEAKLMGFDQPDEVVAVEEEMLTTPEEVVTEETATEEVAPEEVSTEAVAEEPSTEEASKE